jgi:hypothetical protein
MLRCAPRANLHVHPPTKPRNCSRERGFLLGSRPSFLGSRPQRDLLGLHMADVPDSPAVA